MSVSLPSEPHIEIQQLAHAFLQRQTAIVQQVIFWQDHLFVAMAMHSFANRSKSFRMTYWRFITHWLIYFFFFYLFSSWSVSVPPTVSVVSVSCALGVPISWSDTWSYSMCKAHIILQELQAVGLVLGKMAFQLSSKVVALHLDHSIVEAYLQNQGGTASLFLSRYLFCILNLVNKHGITAIPANIPSHLSVEAD